MKNTRLLLLTFAFNVSVSFSQQLSQAPATLFQTNTPNQAPTVNEIHQNFHELMANPDTTLNHDKTVAMRWMNYVFPKFNILDSNQFNTEDYYKSMKAIYSSNIFCGDNDLANWISDGPAYMPDWSGRQSGGWVDAIYADPNNPNVYLLGTRTSGIMKTIDGGDNWNSVTDGQNFPVLGVKQIISAPNNSNYLLAITGTSSIEGGVIYSNDGGNSWNEIQQSTPEFQWVDFHPTIDGLVFATAREEVMYSVDYGLTWQTLGIPIGYDTQYREFFRIVVLEDKFFVTTRYWYGLECNLFRGDFAVIGQTVNNNWSGLLNNDFAPGENLEFVDFSNKRNNSSFFMQTRGSSSKTFVTNDGGATFNLLPTVIPVGGFLKNELIASLNDPDVVYWGSIWFMERYNLSTGVTATIYGLLGNNGHHDDYRSSHIINDNGKDKIVFGNDGGAALVPDGLSATPRIQSLNGNLSINLIHAFNVHEKTGRVAFAFQDHAMRYRNADLTYSNTFIWEGSTAMVQQLYPDAIVGENGYSGIMDKDEITHPIVAGTLGSGACYLGGYFVPYRHFPNRFARGLGATTSANYGKVAMNRGLNISEVSIIPMSHGIGPVAICERNPNFIYAADKLNGNNVDKFYRSVDDGQTWESLINSQVYLDNNATVIDLSSMLEWNVIRAIAVDHFNGNKVYCGIGGTHNFNGQITDERFRVIKSINGGTSFIDYSEGLPALPVERLLTIESDDELIFCATSVGVYYRTKFMSKWECYSKNLPKTEITGMQYDYCNNILYVSTYGRGLWKTEVNIPVSSSYERLINANTLWDEDFILAENVIVKSGITLEITANIYIQKDKKIVVEPGAKLIVDGGRLTNACNDYWSGIEVWGNSNQQQNTINQGVLITKNYAVIEYAKDAIRVWEPDNWNSTGGMVSCTKTTFNNNSRSCEYIYYHNYTLSGNEIPNTGRFTDCTFQWGDDMIGTGLAPAITMFHINGVQISGCDFFDNRTSPVQRAGGVFTIDAGYKVLGRYTGGGIFYPPNFPQHQTYDETDYDVSHFKDLDFGIHAMNSTTVFSVVVDHSKFENNSYGIVLDAVDNAVITRNKYDFNLGQPLDIVAMYQLSLRECNGYKIEGNQFYRSSPYGAVGSLIQNSGAPANEVYRNDYDGVNVGNWGLGFNSNDLSSAQYAKGLQWKCNDYLNGYIDQYNQVLSYDPTLDGEGIRLLQGLPAPGKAAGNTFSSTIVSGGSPYDRHFYNGDQDLIGYYRSMGPNETPTQTEGLITLGLSPANLCPSTFQSKIVIAKSKMITDAERPILENRVVEIDQELNTNKNELDLLLQEGDTPALHALVAGLTNGNKDQVKASLLIASPYLSQSLLEELGQKQPSLFPHSWYKEIIDANIEVARNNDFMETTLTKPFPMPAGMYNDINLNRYTTFTERGEKELVILDLNEEREVIMNLFIADIMSDSSEIDWASVKQLLIDRDHIECKRQIADYHLTREEIPSCHDILDLIELQLSSYEMDRVKGELEDFVFFKRYLLTITGDSGIVKALQPLEITQLEYIADNFEGKAARQARNILCFHEGLCNDIDYEIPMDTHPGNGNKSAEQFTEGNMSKQLQNLDIVPNPNEGIFELGAPENCTVGQVSIVDVTGRTVLFEEIFTDGNKFTIRLIDVQKGIHLINVTCDDGSKYTGRILVVE